MDVSSTAFTDGAPIPAKYTCDGDDSSPPLRWSGAPGVTKSFALIADDPDAPRGTWVHWVLYGIPSSVTELPEGVPATEVLPDGAKHGVTDFRARHYGGPCPPRGPAHRYFFKVYALDVELDMEPGASKAEVEGRMQGRILEQGQLTGTCQR